MTWRHAVLWFIVAMIWACKMAAAMLAAVAVGLLLFHVESSQAKWIGWDVYLLILSVWLFRAADWIVKRALVDHENGHWK